MEDKTHEYKIEHCSLGCYHIFDSADNREFDFDILEGKKIIKTWVYKRHLDSYYPKQILILTVEDIENIENNKE